MVDFSGLRLVILDIDGVVYYNNTIVPGAPKAVKLLRDHGLVVKFLTNDAINSRLTRAVELNALGLDVQEADIYTAASLTARYLQSLGSPQTLLLMDGDAKQEFQGLSIVEHNPECVVVADIFNSYSFEKLNQAFSAIRNGAYFIAMQRNRCWLQDGVPVIDTGFWVAGLEHSTGVPAHTVGKPSIESYLTVCQDSNVSAYQAVMISDDVSSDLLGASEAGLQTVHVIDFALPLDVTAHMKPDLVVPNLIGFAELVCSVPIAS